MLAVLGAWTTTGAPRHPSAITSLVMAAQTVGEVGVCACLLLAQIALSADLSGPASLGRSMTAGSQRFEVTPKKL